MAEIYISQFTKYLSAPPASAERVGRKLAQETGRYHHWTDFWLQLKNALLTDRRGTRDGQALAAAAAAATDAKKKGPYAAAARNWVQLAPWWDGLEHERQTGRSVQVGDLTVRLPRLCAERHPDGELEVLYVRFNRGRLPLHVVLGVLRIVQRAYPSETITFVDVERATMHTTRGRDLSVYDEWLNEAGNDLAQLLNDVGQDGQAAA
ncbi:hypothetical protein APR04_004289 [Promicromonospora umidemergens]|uniref:Uncharacterized protein n=1 Tax=Promicromonospora umidemergens TaxID=629679 RepID=A0ABP8XSJ4_9MICO|nr:hypothetical protein [Promicromonospora umidemergens]MCP2285357.1 hypothetical protein [Promicromonospora umidemergens]